MYTIKDFPIETDQPQIDVSLPVGTHVLELIVEDSAGMKSAPSYVTITVVKEKEVTKPRITGISPDSGQPGAMIEAEITGENLQDATAVTFSDEKIKALILAWKKNTDRSLNVRIEIDQDAVPGPRQFTVVTKTDDKVQSPDNINFSVEEPGRKLQKLQEALEKAEHAYHVTNDAFLKVEEMARRAQQQIPTDKKKMLESLKELVSNSVEAIRDAYKVAKEAGSEHARVLGSSSIKVQMALNIFNAELESQGEKDFRVVITIAAITKNMLEAVDLVVDACKKLKIDVERAKVS